MSFEESTVIGLSDWRDNTGKNATWKNLKSIVRKSVVYAGPVINRLEALRIIDHKTDGRIRGIAINLDSNIEWKILGKYLGLSSVQLLHIQADNLKFGALNMAYNMLLSWISTVESVEEIYPLLGKALKLADRLDLANIVEIWITESQPSSRDMTPIDEEQSESDSKVLTGDDDPSYNGDDDDNKDQNENDGEKKNEEEENERDEEEDQESEADIPDDHDVPDVNDKRDDDNNYDDDFFDDDGDNDNLLPDDSNDQRDKSPDSKNG
uniref:Phosphopantothenoylcysteine decarboxylase subunit SIS2-like n=1 Tax=Saccoglossus kowalevskii TaxID=10224 RepID=A0ABM0MIQ1_SACKO|nr:PREDICTED: phosphopantothenoylcysteine decarboxylase subunit SIS2-like [Saccoglossus kowalevskii]